MKKYKQILFIIMALILVGAFALPVIINAEEGNSDEYSLVVQDKTLYNLEDNSGYYPSDDKRVFAFSSGHTSLGELRVYGDIIRKYYQNQEGYAVVGDSIRFEYTQNWVSDGKWLLSSDTATSIAGIETGKIGNGGVIILKSLDDGQTWEHTGATTVEADKGKVVFTPDGADVAKGVHYKFISVLEAYYVYKSGSHKEWIFWPFSYEMVDDYSSHFENFVQQSVVYVANDHCQIGLYSEYTDGYSPELDVDEARPELLELLKTAGTLTNNSVSLDKIRVDFLGIESYDVTCSYNGGGVKPVSDKQVYTAPGRYVFNIVSSFGTKRSLTVYKIDPGEDYAYSQYFPQGIVDQSKRLYDKESVIPVYMVGTELTFSTVKNLPGLYGNIIRFDDEKALKAGKYSSEYTINNQTSEKRYALNNVGIYCADLYTGNPTLTGEVIHYSFYIKVVHRPEYKPSVNEEILFSADRHVMLKTSAYTVNFYTAGGGAYVFMFEASEEGRKQALDFAEKIEYRFIEEYVDANGIKYYYYKTSVDNAQKTRYDSKVELYSVLEECVQNNVSHTYINNSDSYAIMTLDEAYSKIEDTSIKSDIRVTIDLATRDKLVASDAILNGFAFFCAAPFETSKVELIDENGTVYHIDYDTPVEEVITQTGRYTIREYNWNDVNEYEASFFARGDVTGKINFTAHYNYDVIDGVISARTTGGVIDANYIVFNSAFDVYDSQSIVTVAGNGQRTTMLLSEVNGFVISEPGEYTVSIINRCGFEHTETVRLVQAPLTKVEFSGYPEFDRTVEYETAFGTLPHVEREGYVFHGWITSSGEAITSDTVCEWKNVVTLVPVFEPKVTDIILNFFNGYYVISAEFGSVVELPEIEGVGDVFGFAYWEYNGKAVTSISIDSMRANVLVAKYYLYSEGKDSVYNAYEVIAVLEELERELNERKIPDSFTAGALGMIVKIAMGVTE